jgi:hypothetical protein
MKRLVNAIHGYKDHDNARSNARENPFMTFETREAVRQEIIDNYLLAQVEGLRPALKLTIKHRRHYTSRIYNIQRRNHELAPPAGKPGKIGSSEPLTPIDTRPRPGRTAYSYIPMKITHRPLKRVFTEQEILFREFFNEVTAQVQQEKQDLTIEEARVKADYAIQRASGKPYSMQRVIDEVNKLREYPELCQFNTLQLLRKLQSITRNKGKKHTESQRSQEIKRLKTKLGEYIPPQPPQLLPNASLTVN